MSTPNGRQERGRIKAGERYAPGPVPSLRTVPAAGTGPGLGTGPKLKARRLKIGGYRGLVAAAYDDPVFLAALSPPESLGSRPGAEILSEGRNRIVRLSLPLSAGAPADIIVKEFSSRGVNKLKSIIIPSKAARAWRGASESRKKKWCTCGEAFCCTISAKWASPIASCSNPVP